MQKPVMIKRILFIALFLSCLALPRNADARLTLGAVSEGAEGGIAAARVETLAARIAEQLGDEVTVKWLDDADSVLKWLERYAQLDLALLANETVEKYRGRFLVVGPISKDSSLNLVARQGVPGDVPGLLAELVSKSGASPWRGTEASPTVEPEPVPVLEEAPVLAAPEPDPLPGGVENVPPDRTGRAWQPGEAVTLPDIAPVSEPDKKNLVLAVVPDATGLVRTGPQAEELAGYLEATLPVSVTVREFTRLETFAEWFMRYRMVDIAVISPELAMLNLGRDYMPVAKLYRSDKPGAESAELVVMRRGGDEDLQEQVQQVLLEMPKTSDGQQSMAQLKISDIFAPGLDRFEPAPEPIEAAPAATPVVVPEAEGPVVIAAKEKAPGLPEPVQPKPPVSIALPGPPDLAGAAEPVPAPESPAMPEAVSLPKLPAKPEPPATETDLPEKVRDEETFVAALPGETAPMLPRFPGEPTAVTLPVVPPSEPRLPEEPAAVTLPTIPPVEPGIPAPPVVAPQLPAVPETPVLPGVELPAPEPVTLPETEVQDVALLKDPEPTQPQAPAEPDTVTLPTVSKAEPDISVPPVVVAPQLPAVPEAPVPPAIEPSVPEPVTAVEVPQPALPQDVAAAPEMPPLPGLPPAEVKEVATPVAVALPTRVQEPALPDAKPPVSEPVSEPVAESQQAVTEKPGEEMSAAEEQRILEEVLEFAEPITSQELQEKVIVLPEGDDVDLSEQDLVAVLGEDSVASMVAQPKLPQELRPSGIPVVRPGRVKPPTAVKEELLVASLPEPLKPVEPPKPPDLLPQPEPEPGIVYVIPFVSVMVPQEVRAGIFDQFVDLLNQQGDALGYQFLILKEGLQRVSPEWLAARKYVTGELYAYVEDRGATSTDLRSKARMIYHNPGQQTDALNFEYPARIFFNHDSSTLEAERTKMANNIAETLSKELIKALQN